MGKSLHILFNELAPEVKSESLLFFDCLSEEELKDDDVLLCLLYNEVDRVANERVNSPAIFDDVSFGDVAKVAKSLLVSYRTGYVVKSFR